MADMDWPTTINLFISVAAITLSLAALRSNVNQRRLDSFVRTQEFLLAPDLQVARSKVYVADTTGKITTDEDLTLVMRAFATFNTVAEMARRGAVDRNWVLDEWHHHLRRMRKAFELALAQRAQWHDFNPWCDLDDLIRDAENYTIDRPCCTGPTLAQRGRLPTGPV
jgi:hypothetical protein